MEIVVQLVALGDGGAEETLMLGKGTGGYVLFLPLRISLYQAGSAWFVGMSAEDPTMCPNCFFLLRKRRSFTR